MSLLRTFRSHQPLRHLSCRFLPVTATRSFTPAVSISKSGIELHHASHDASASASAEQSDSKPKRSLFPNIWLRDSCRCDKCVNQDTLQRNFNTFALPKDLEAVKAKAENDGLKIEWNDGHQSAYSWDFMSFYVSNDARLPENVGQMPWGAEIGEGPECDFEAQGKSVDSLSAEDLKRAPAVSYEDVMDESKPGISRLTKYIRKFGFVFVTGTPATPEATEKVLERIAFIRVTHYGGFYDFIPDLAMADTAYTNLALPAHTDTTYFTDPAGLQSFHMLEHKAPPGAKEGEKIGGESLLVDGLKAAETLLAEDPTAFKILATVRLPWHASGNKGINIAPDMRYPVLEMDWGVGKLHRIRWNNDDRGVVPFDSEYSPEKWYEAAGKWDAILRRKNMEFWVQLTPGKVLVFDNWRVMHGRAAFTGIRRICGGYTTRDDFISRWRNTNYPRDQIMKQVVG